MPVDDGELAVIFIVAAVVALATYVGTTLVRRLFIMEDGEWQHPSHKLIRARVGYMPMLKLSRNAVLHMLTMLLLFGTLRLVA